MVNVALVVLAVYMIAMMGVGIYAARFTEDDPTDYYVADKKVGTLVLTFTLLATVLSSWTFFGVGATASGTGLGVFVFLGVAAPFYGLMFAVIGRKFNRVGRIRDILTPSEYIRDRYESNAVALVYLVVSIIFLTAFICAQIVGGGVALEVLVDIPYVWSIGAIAVFMAIYIHIAGFRGVIWSDLIQGAVLSLVLLGMFLWVNGSVGGDQIVQQATAESPDLFTLLGPAGLWTPAFLLSYAAFFAIGVPAYPQIIQRYLSADSPAVMRKTGIVYPLIAIPVYLFAAVLGAWSVGVVSNPPNPDYVIPLMIQQLTNPIVFGIAMAGGIAALMSTADSVILTLSSMASHDIYREYVDPEMSQADEVRVTQVFLLLIIGLALVLAYFRPAGIFQLASLAVAGFAATAPALFLGAYWNGATEEGALASMILGSAIMLGFFTETIPGSLTYGMHYGLIGTVAAFLIFIVVSKITSTPSETVISDHVSVSDD
jgi:SSS family solute:Na+ symporter